MQKNILLLTLFFISSSKEILLYGTASQNLNSNSNPLSWDSVAIDDPINGCESPEAKDVLEAIEEVEQAAAHKAKQIARKQLRQILLAPASNQPEEDQKNAPRRVRRSTAWGIQIINAKNAYIHQHLNWLRERQEIKSNNGARRHKFKTKKNDLRHAFISLMRLTNPRKKDQTRAHYQSWLKTMFRQVIESSPTWQAYNYPVYATKLERIRAEQQAQAANNRN